MKETAFYTWQRSIFHYGHSHFWSLVNELFFINAGLRRMVVLANVRISSPLKLYKAIHISRVLGSTPVLRNPVFRLLIRWKAQIGYWQILLRQLIRMKMVTRESFALL